MLASLLALLLPRIGGAAQQSRQALLSESLQYLRTQIALYTIQHGCPPGVDGTTVDSKLFLAQMTGYTDAAGHVSPIPTEKYCLGPYLLAMPQNPINDNDALRMVRQMATPSLNSRSSFGWIYNAQTQQIVADLSDSDDQGFPYVSY